MPLASSTSQTKTKMVEESTALSSISSREEIE